MTPHPLGGAGDDAQASDVVAKMRGLVAAMRKQRFAGSAQIVELGLRELDRQTQEQRALRTQVAEQQAEIARLKQERKADSEHWQKAENDLAMEQCLRQRAEQERDQEKAWADLVARGKSPLCGHWKVLAHTEDGGKRIDCYACEAERYRQERDTARAALVAVLDNARYGFRGTPYRESLDGAMRLLGYHCSDCGAVYKSNEIHDHATKTCKGQWIAALQSSAPASDEKTS